MKKWLLIIIAILVAAGVWIGHGLYYPYRGYRGGLVLVIKPGARVPEVASQLVREGVLATRLPFLIRYWIGRWNHRTLKYGQYLFRRPLSASQVYDKLARGEVYLHAVVVPEGSDRFDMARIFARDLGVNPEAFLAATHETGAIRDLDPQAPTLEGYLFPDTYRFPRDVAPARIVQAMVARFHEIFVSEIRSELAGQSWSLHDVITLASLVESETPNPAERSLIAGVFVRRLQLGMALECDPTVIYAVRLSRGRSDVFTGPITAEDLRIASPFNTYLHTGLPPGPICSPGLASIRAALHPAPGKALYFVSNNHGGHVFADTLAEQNRNVSRYREELKAAQQLHPVPHPPYASHRPPIR